jgi:hypothetical protein
MANNARTLGEAYNASAVGSGVARWTNATSTQAAVSQVQKWLKQTFPYLNTAQRTTIYETIRDAVRTGRMQSSGNLGFSISDNDAPDTRANQRTAGRTGPGVYYYKVSLKYKYKRGDRTTAYGYYQDIIQSDKPLTNEALINKTRATVQRVQAMFLPKGSDPRKAGAEITSYDTTTLAVWRGL